MIFNIYVIYNRKIEAYERPIFAYEKKDDFAERVHRDYLASGNLERSKILECDVYSLGTYDDSTGMISLAEKDLVISCAVFDKPITEAN